MEADNNTISEQQQLVSDMKSVIADAEDMLQATADQIGDKVTSRLDGARARLKEAEAVLVAKTRAAARATDAYVHESPWTAIGVAAGVGLLAGLVLSRR